MRCRCESKYSAGPFLHWQFDCTLLGEYLGPPVVHFVPTFWVGRVPLLKSTTEKRATLILTSLLEDLWIVMSRSGMGESTRRFIFAGPFDHSTGQDAALEREDTPKLKVTRIPSQILVAQPAIRFLSFLDIFSV